uniref:CD4-1 molecule n=1 Tax=Scatophagus argus TaxID=75038 RepID=UPI001ED8148B|nr:CD4-1 molecule [Scatophagus argus]
MKNLIQSVLILIAVLEPTTGTKQVKYAEVGKSTILNPPDGISSRSYMYWYFGDIEIAWRNTLGGHGLNEDGKETEKWKNILSWSGDSLIIQNIRQEHFGIFACKVLERNVRKTIMTYELLEFNVSVNPPSPVLAGESLSLVCKGANTQDGKQPEIHWLNPQEEKVTSNKGALTEKATGQHRGRWTCVLTVDEQENRATISVEVVDLAPAHPTQYTSKNRPLHIPCSINPPTTWEQIKAKGFEEGNWHFYPDSGSRSISDIPEMLFSLHKDSLVWKAKERARDLTPVNPEKGDLSLTRTKGKDADRGTYVCSLKFSNGVTLSRTVHVDVLQITSSPGTELISGQQVNLSCSLGHPLPSGLQLKLIPPKQSSQTSDSPHLTIREVGVRDNGNWKCELWQNKTQLTWAMTSLKIETKMSVWMLVIICSVAVIVPLLILVFILCRFRQRKVRHVRHRLCQCKNPKPKGFYRT